MARRKTFNQYTGDQLTSDESRLLDHLLHNVDARLEIISKFGMAIESLEIDNIAGVIHESKLPYRKLVIEPCLIKEISTSSDENVVKALSTAAVFLATYQAGFNESDLPVPPLSLTENCAPIKFWHYRRKKAIREFAAEVEKSGDLVRRLTEKVSTEARRIQERVQAAKIANPHFGHGQANDFREGRVSLKAIPLTGSTPDFFSAEPIWMEGYNRDFALFAYRDIKPLAVRRGGKEIISYPFVFAVIDVKTSKPVYLVTAEFATMSNTSCLCAFDGEGRHINFGSWNLDSGDAEFIERAKSIVNQILARS